MANFYIAFDKVVRTFINDRYFKNSANIENHYKDRFWNFLRLDELIEQRLANISLLSSAIIGAPKTAFILQEITSVTRGDGVINDRDIGNLNSIEIRRAAPLAVSFKVLDVLSDMVLRREMSNASSQKYVEIFINYNK